MLPNEEGLGFPAQSLQMFRQQAALKTAKSQGLPRSVAQARSLIVGLRNRAVTPNSPGAGTLMPQRPPVITEPEEVLTATVARAASPRPTTSGGGGGGVPVAPYDGDDEGEGGDVEEPSRAGGGGMLALMAVVGLVFLAPRLLKRGRRRAS